MPSRRLVVGVSMSSYFLLWLLLLLSIQLGAQENAGSKNDNLRRIDPLVTTTIEHYEIRGTSFDDIRQELDAKGHGGAGSTTGEVTYRFKSRKRDGTCEILEVRASCTTKVRLPRWYGVEKTSAQVQAIWNEAYKKLRKHEMGHVQICIEVAKEVEKALWATPASNDCADVDQEARARANVLVRGMNAKQLAFDEREYGSTVRSELRK